MADENDDSVTVDRSGERPVRTDKRGVLHMIHDELGKALGIGQATDRKVAGGKGLMDTVDDAVNGAKGANPDY